MAHTTCIDSLRIGFPSSLRVVFLNILLYSVVRNESASSSFFFFILVCLFFFSNQNLTPTEKKNNDTHNRFYYFIIFSPTTTEREREGKNTRKHLLFFWLAHLSLFKYIPQDKKNNNEKKTAITGLFARVVRKCVSEWNLFYSAA